MKLEKKNGEEWSNIKDDYSALIAVRLINSIVTDYERIAGDIAKQ